MRRKKKNKKNKNKKNRTKKGGGKDETIEAQQDIPEPEPKPMEVKPGKMDREGGLGIASN